MANVFVNLAVPAGDGSGAATVVSGMSQEKTITVGGTLSGPALTVEFSLDNTNWFAVATFSKPGDKQVKLAAGWMRVTISGYAAGMGLAANVDVGAVAGVERATALNVPVSDGNGAAADVSAFGEFNTIVVSGTFTGAVHVEISEDNVAWLPCASFTNHGSKSLVFSAHYMRVRRGGCDPQLPGTPVVYVAAIDEIEPAIAAGYFAETFAQDYAVHDVYVDGVNGDDGNDGLTELTALETIQAVYEKFPIKTYNGARVVVHIAGVGGFDEDATDPLTYDIATILIGGVGHPWCNSFAYVGPEMVPVTPTTGPATATADATPAVAVAGGSASAGGTLSVRFDFTTAAPGWTPHDFQRYFLRVTRAGAKVTWEMPIADNDADQIWVRISGIAPLFLDTDTYEIVEPAVVFEEQQIADAWGSCVITGTGSNQLRPDANPSDVGATFQRCNLLYGPMLMDAHAVTFDRCAVGYWDGPYMDRSSGEFFNCTCGVVFAYGWHGLPWGCFPKQTGAADPIVANRKYGMNLQVASMQASVIIGSDVGRMQNGGVFHIDLGLGIDGETYSDGPAIRICGNGVLVMFQRPNGWNSVALQGVIETLVGNAIVCEQGGQARLLGNDRSYAGAVSLYFVTGGDPLALTDAGLTCDYGTAAGDWEEAAGYDGVFVGPPSAGTRGDYVSNITAY